MKILLFIFLVFSCSIEQTETKCKPEIKTITKTVIKEVPAKKKCNVINATLSDGFENFRVSGCEHRINKIIKHDDLIDMIKELVRE